MPNPIHDLLMRVGETGQMPTDAEVKALLIHTPGARNQHSARQQLDNTRRGILNAARRVLATVEQGYDHQVAQIAEDTADKYADYTAGGTAADVDLAKAIAGAGPNDLGQTMHGQARTGGKPIDRQALAPLGDLLTVAAAGQVITDADIDELATVDMDGEQRAKWRADVLAAAKHCNQLRSRGQLGDAREYGRQATHELGDAMQSQARTSDDVTDPRELADLITNHTRRGAA